MTFHFCNSSIIEFEITSLRRTRFFIIVIPPPDYQHPNYLRRAERLLTQEQIDEIADILASNPESGDLIQGTGGCRRLRYAGVQGNGKSSGSRVIHLYVTRDQEVHLLDIYGKGEKSNLSKAERNELAKLAAILEGD